MDNGWNWMLDAPFTRLFGIVLARRPVGYAVGIADGSAGRFLPCALTLPLGRDRALDGAPRRYPDRVAAPSLDDALPAREPTLAVFWWMLLRRLRRLRRPVVRD